MLWAVSSLYISFWIRSREENQNVLIIPVADSVFSDLFSHFEKICSFIGKLWPYYKSQADDGWQYYALFRKTEEKFYGIVFHKQTVLLHMLSALFFIHTLLLQRPFGSTSLKCNIL